VGRRDVGCDRMATPLGTRIKLCFFFSFIAKYFIFILFFLFFFIFFIFLFFFVVGVYQVFVLFIYLMFIIIYYAFLCFFIIFLLFFCSFYCFSMHNHSYLSCIYVNTNVIQTHFFIYIRVVSTLR